MQDSVKRFYTFVERFYRESFEQLVKVKANLEKCSDLEELADQCYALREVRKLLEDLRKETQKVEELAWKITCVLWITTSTTGDPIRTSYCTATPDVKQIASIPKKSTKPKEFHALMSWLGVPEELWAGEMELVRVHWPDFVAAMSDRASDGKPLPPGIDFDKTYPQYRVIVRPKRTVTGEEK